MAANKQHIPPELEELFALGKAGKLWAMEIIYTLEGETKQVRKRNMTVEELMKFRETMFRYGMTHPVEPGHWKIVCPMDINSVDVYKQATYLPDLPSGFTK